MPIAPMHQAIDQTSVVQDLRHQKASLGPNEFKAKHFSYRHQDHTNRRMHSQNRIGQSQRLGIKPLPDLYLAGTYPWEIKIGWGNGLVPSGNLAIQINTVMSLLEVPYLIEAPPIGSARWYRIVALGAYNNNWIKSIHKYIVQARHMLLKITMADTTTCFNGLGLHKLSCVSMSQCWALLIGTLQYLNSSHAGDGIFWLWGSAGMVLVALIGKTTCIIVPEFISSTWVKQAPRYNSKCEHIYYSL